MTSPAPTTGPPPLGPVGVYTRAYLEGLAAGDNGATRAECPYPASAPFRRRAWLKGLVRAEGEAGRAPEVDVDDDAPWPGGA